MCCVVCNEWLWLTFSTTEFVSALKYQDAWYCTNEHKFRTLVKPSKLNSSSSLNSLKNHRTVNSFGTCRLYHRSVRTDTASCPRRLAFKLKPVSELRISRHSALIRDANLQKLLRILIICSRNGRRYAAVLRNGRSRVVVGWFTGSIFLPRYVRRQNNSG